MRHTYALFENRYSIHPLYVMMIINRLQVNYFIFIMPAHLKHPYMIWIILGVGLLSQLNILILNKGLQAFTGIQAFSKLKSKCFSLIGRFLAIIAVAIILLKIVVLTLGYMDIVSIFIFPYMNKTVLLFVFIMTAYYVALQGMANTIRFVVIIFISTIVVIFLYIPFFMPSTASIQDLYPLIPTDWNMESWKGILLMWSLLSGPEFAVFLLPWLKPHPKTVRYLSIGNALSVLEYVTLFIASLLFFGPNLLAISNYPAHNMLRYLQTIIVERIDILLICVRVIHFTYSLALFMLIVYGLIKIISGNTKKPTTLLSFSISSFSIFLILYIIEKWFWIPSIGLKLNIWFDLIIWVSAIMYITIPLLLYFLSKRWKGSLQ